MTDAIPCKKCGGDGHLVCRPNIYTLVGELYTVDCVACDNTTNDEHAEPAEAIEQWNAEQASCNVRSLDTDTDKLRRRLARY